MAKSKTTKIRQSARDEACTLRVSTSCQDGETVVLCHLNSPYKGIALKSPDIFGAYGCYRCHQQLDAGMVSKGDQLRALMETQFKMMEKGLINVA